MRIHHYIVGSTAAALLAAPCGAITFQDDNAPAIHVEVPAAGAAVNAPASIPQPQQENGITFVSGGAGKEERQALEATGPAYNFKMTVAAPNGELIAPDSVRISDQAGKALLVITPKGPLVFAKLPPGAYSVVATTAGKDVTQAVTVSSQGQQAITLTMNPEPAAAPRAGDAPDLPRPAAPSEADKPIQPGSSADPAAMPEAE